MSTAYTDEEIERCTLSAPREIAFYLRGLIKNGERLSVAFDEGRQSFLTVLLGLSEDHRQLYFDISGSESANRAFVKSARGLFSGLVDGIRVQFAVEAPRLVKLHGEIVFAVPLPHRFLRLQRREMFRLQLSAAKPYLCRLRRGSAEEMELPLHDISVGGVGFHVGHELHFESTELLERCEIDLRDFGVLSVTLEVRFLSVRESRTGKPLYQMGCKFIGLSAHDETQIQRFMAHVQAEQRSLSAG